MSWPQQSEPSKPKGQVQFATSIEFIPRKSTTHPLPQDAPNKRVRLSSDFDHIPPPPPSSSLDAATTTSTATTPTTTTTTTPRRNVVSFSDDVEIIPPRTPSKVSFAATATVIDGPKHQWESIWHFQIPGTDQMAWIDAENVVHVERREVEVRERHFS